MPGTAAMKWLRDLTGETTTRHIGAKIGRSHVTVMRWAKHGIPPRAVLQLVAENHCDLMDTLETLGWLSPEERAKIAPTIDQLPTGALAAEVHRLSGIVHDRVTEQNGDDCARSEG